MLVITVISTLYSKVSWITSDTRHSKHIQDTFNLDVVIDCESRDCHGVAVCSSWEGHTIMCVNVAMIMVVMAWADAIYQPELSSCKTCAVEQGIYSFTDIH